MEGRGVMGNLDWNPTLQRAPPTTTRFGQTIRQTHYQHISKFKPPSLLSPFLLSPCLWLENPTSFPKYTNQKKKRKQNPYNILQKGQKQHAVAAAAAAADDPAGSFQFQKFLILHPQLFFPSLSLCALNWMGSPPAARRLLLLLIFLLCCVAGISGGRWGERETGQLGSCPPTCRSKCGRCWPCDPVHVPIQPGLSFPLEYYPEAWRCKCGNNLFMPWLHQPQQIQASSFLIFYRQTKKLLYMYITWLSCHCRGVYVCAL